VSPSQSATKRQQRAILLALTVAILSTALALVLGFASIVWSIVIGYFVYLRQTRSHRALLWLRRFHQSEPERLRFQFALNRACAALCLPITIQDSSYKTSYLAGGSQLILLIPLFFGISFLLAVMTAIAIYFAAEVTLGVSNISIALAALIGLGILIASSLAVKKFLHLKGHKQLTRENAVPTLLKLLERIRRQKSFSLGTLVLKCGDEFWREVVQECMRGVDVVLIDVSDITDNVLWEIQTIAAISPKRPMLLAYGVTAPEEQQLPEEIRSKLGTAIGDERLAKTLCIYYPAKSHLSDALVAGFTVR
jgi:membrane protein implicated in regulation of membrane protease activity